MTSRPGDGLVRVCALLGLVVSAYALYVEHEVAAAAAAGLEYKAACDLSATMSCSKVLTSSCRCNRYHALMGPGIRAAALLLSAQGGHCPEALMMTCGSERGVHPPAVHLFDKTCITVR
jgi:hypothetical protein